VWRSGVLKGDITDNMGPDAVCITRQFC
jgi:hypothetical protein